MSIVISDPFDTDRTNWVFAQRSIYAFHAQLPVPPELAVVTLKRLWSNQVTPNDIVSICDTYQVQQILLNREQIQAGWHDFPSNNYILFGQNHHAALYLLRSLASRIPEEH